MINWVCRCAILGLEIGELIMAVCDVRIKSIDLVDVHWLSMGNILRLSQLVVSAVTELV